MMSRELLSLRWSLALLAASLILGGGVVVFTRDLVRKAEGEHGQLASRRQEIRARLDNIREEEKDIRDRTARYRQVIDSGLIAQEERLGWVERIARVKSARRLLDMEYEFSPQHPIDEAVLPGGATAAPYQYMASTWKLKMALLHEDDLLGLLDDLRASVHAYLLVRDCRVERLEEASTQSGVAPRLRAECTIDWVTLREKKS